MSLIHLNSFHILAEWLLCLSFQDYTAVIVQIVIFWVVTLCNTLSRTEAHNLNIYRQGNLAVFTGVTVPKSAV
jgi:hypothetical protein